MVAERHVTILNEKGLHVRPATALSQAACKFKSRITVLADGRPVNAKSSIELLTLAATAGTDLTIRADGDDAEAAADALVKLVEDKFGMRDD